MDLSRQVHTERAEFAVATLDREERVLGEVVLIGRSGAFTFQDYLTREQARALALALMAAAEVSDGEDAAAERAALTRAAA